MLLCDLYPHLTHEAAAQAVQDILLLAEARGIQCSREYLLGLFRGGREHSCSEALARLVSGYVRGAIGVDVSPQDVLASVKSNAEAAA